MKCLAQLLINTQPYVDDEVLIIKEYPSVYQPNLNLNVALSNFINTKYAFDWKRERLL